MRFGVSFFMQNYEDWGRHSARAFEGPAATADHEIWDRSLRLADQVEPLGFDSLWTVEHHFTPYTMVPNPLQFLTYMAGRTSRVDVGTMVVVLPWHDPVEVAEQIAMLDLVLGGRQLTLGFGRGAGRVEFEGFRVPMHESRVRFTEALEVVRRAITQESFSFDGEFYQLPEMSIRPRPRDPQRLLDRMYQAWGSPETVRMAAEADLGPLFVPQKPWEDIRAEVELYDETRQSMGKPSTRPIVACWVSCFETEEEAWDVALHHMGNYNDSVLRHYELGDPEHFAQTGVYDYYAERARRRSMVTADQATRAFAASQAWGTPDRCLAALRHIVEVTGAAELIGVFDYGAMPVELAERSMQLFAREVLPQVHAGALDVERADTLAD
jgi:alkanesulfonate monooxygenase SsuD/methylene tetrahydromethanopterin reductase-like flavin-dependent oxidoreductase (luciferase family)